MERLKAILFRGRRRQELDEELRFHLERDVEARMRRGVAEADARRDAKLSLGGVDQVKELVDDASGVRPLADLAADLRFGARALRRNAGLTATIVVVLGLAIGAATAVFAVVNGVLLSQLPYPHADRLIRILNESSPQNRWGLSIADYLAIRDQQRVFDAVGLLRTANMALTSPGGEPEQVRAGRITPGFLSALGLRAAAGRLLAKDDETPGAAPVVVVSHHVAVTRFGSAAAAVNRAVTLDGLSYTVIGVLPPGVNDLAGIEAGVWPAMQVSTPPRRGPFGLMGIALVREGVTPDMVQRDLAGISARIFPVWQSSFADRSARFFSLSLRESLVGSTARPLRLLAAAVLLVLLVAVANIATLALVRISAREHELATRARLGASRVRLVRLVVTENLLAVLLAGMAGLGLAAMALRLAGALLPRLPRVGEVALDGRAVAFAAVATLAAALLVSVAPAVAVVRGRLLSSRVDGRRMSAGRRANAVRSALVAAEFMLALPLLVTAALLGRSFLNLSQVSPGFDPSHAFTIAVSLPEARYADSASGALPTTGDFWRRALQRAQEAPGVVSAALTTSLPPNNGGDVNNFNLLDHPVPPGGEEPVAPWATVSSDYFATLSVPLLDGRLFNAADTANGLPVAIVSRAWAARHFPGRSVLGQQFISGGCTTCPPTVIVGVVGDVKYLGLAGTGEGMYAPAAQDGARSAQLVIRTAASPASAMGPVIAALRSVDPALPLAGRTMDDRLRSELSAPGRWTILLGAFAAVALALSALGIFGLMSYLVRRQRREIGVRMALGAEPAQVARMVVGRGMRCVAPGIVGGVLLMLAAARWTESLLYGVAPRDPATIALVTAVLLASAIAACLLPGFRAARIRPAEAIASE